MIEKKGLLEALVDGFVIFDKHGRTVDIDLMDYPNSPTLLVEDVTDALKRVSGDRVVGSADRGETWRVKAMILSTEAVESLSDDSYRAEELLGAIEAAGLRWVVCPISSL